MYLSDFERKLLVILSHHNKRGHRTSIKELEIKTGRSEVDIKKTLEHLINIGFITEKDNYLVVKNSLF